MRLWTVLLLFAGAPAWAVAPAQPFGFFTANQPLEQSQAGLSAVALNDGTALVVEGDQAWRFDPVTNAYQSLTMASAHPVAALARLKNGRVLVVGTGSNDPSLPAAEVFDPVTNQFAPAGALVVRRNQANAVTLLDGRVVVLGGMTPAPESRVVTQAELYDPAINAFSSAGVSLAPRLAETVTLLATGDVLLAGGTDNQTHVYFSAEVYRTASGSFESTGPMNAYRVDHAAALLPDGSVLVTGGFGNPTSGVVGLSSGVVQSSAERYLPAQGMFVKVAASMTDSRQWHTASTLPDGRVLLAGGQDDNTGLISQGELFDPRTQTFTRITAPMTTPRIQAATAMASNGQPLFLGGLVYNANQSAFVTTPAVEHFTLDEVFANAFESED